ncbi:unnamed protein product, partial [Amoebophrya sp. A120]
RQLPALFEFILFTFSSSSHLLLPGSSLETLTFHTLHLNNPSEITHFYVGDPPPDAPATPIRLGGLLGF